MFQLIDAPMVSTLITRCISSVRAPKLLLLLVLAHRPQLLHSCFTITGWVIGCLATSRQVTVVVSMRVNSKAVAITRRYSITSF